MDYVAAYVRSLGSPDAMRNNYLAAQGKPLYEGVCVACHGIDGKGNAEMGAPDLTDGYWLYGGSSDAIRESIANGRKGSMPAHAELLGDTRARLVAAYVWSLSQPRAAAAGAAPASD